LDEAKRELLISTFRDDMNRWRSRSLFVETIYASVIANGTKPVFTLRETDHPDGYLSLKKLYLSAMDPTEYRFAVSVFGSYECWENLCECDWFKPHVTIWRKELSLLLQAISLDHVSGATDALALTKHKWLYEQYRALDGDAPKRSKRGRPSKEEVQRIAIEHARAKSVTNEDAERLGLTVVK